MFGQTLNVHAQSLCMVFLLQLAMFVASTTRLLGFPQSLHHISEKKTKPSLLSWWNFPYPNFTGPSSPYPAASELAASGTGVAGSNRRSRSSQVWDSDRGDRGDHAVNSVDRFQTVVGINLVYPWIYLHIYVYVLYIDIYIWLSQLIGVISIYFHVYRCIHEEALACTQKVGIDEDTSSTMRVLHGYKQ